MGLVHFLLGLCPDKETELSRNNQLGERSRVRGASSTLLLAILENPVHAIANQTAILPVSLQFSTPLGEFFHLKWDFLSGHRPVLAYVLTKCSGSAPEWGRRSCQRSVKVAEEYQQQANVSLQSGSLVIQRVQPADAGTYQITVRGLDVFVMAEVNLTVTGAAAPANTGRVNRARFSCVPNTIRLGLAILVLCVLGLIVGEAVYKPAGCSLHHLEESQERSWKLWTEPPHAWICSTENPPAV
ncbi:uncharacterized protein LOC127033109 [Gopherus flavomarginatus]|uniref:uncharacterized protein LOC127033109 n=1 Tax=Gopherus flavomarginatus TaxID=286002 RepID=UPI0021CBAAFC|nr:uncharacterized protein LOC127033109 [Gopherus flavomarginatus]